MKICFPILVVLVFVLQLPAAETNIPAPLKIGTGEADKHYDQEMIVTGKVVQVTIRPTIVFLNLDKPHPDSPFTAVIFPNFTNQFGDLKSLQGKSVEVQGKVKKYNGKPEIVLESTNQLMVAGSTASTNASSAK